MAIQGRRNAKNALFDAFASIGGALSSGRRAELIELLSQGGRTVEALAGEIDQSIANTSHHLRSLARAGLVTSQRSGTHVRYRLASDDVLQLWWALRKVAASQVSSLPDLARDYLGDRTDIGVTSRDELLRRLERGDIVVVDVRPAAEYAAGHLPGALHVPPDQLDRLDDLPADQDVVAYCRGPYCVYADDAVRHLRARGRRATRLEDGLPEWSHAGGAVETGNVSS